MKICFLVVSSSQPQRSISLKNDRLSPGQLKKPLAAINSISGNIKVYFPGIEKKFLADLKTHHCALADYAMKKGVIRKPTGGSGMPRITASGKVLDAIRSILGNLKVYFPDLEAGFLDALQAKYPEPFRFAVREGVIKVPEKAVDCPESSLVSKESRA